MEVQIPNISINSYDPTRTTSLRNAFVRDVKRRFVELKTVIYQALVVQDCFGLAPGTRVATFQVAPPGYKAFAFLRDPQKIEAFMRWLQQQVNKGLLTIGQFQQIGHAIEYAWTNQYVLDAYKRGVLRARYELQKVGFKVPSIDDTGGIDVSMGLPFHMDRVGVLFTRVFSELTGITAAMDNVISQILAQGMIAGDGPLLIARKLIAAIDGTNLGKLGIIDSIGRFIPAERRAIMLARTEIIRAFHLATIQEYRNWAVEGVIVKAEWSTAGDERVCPDCASREGKVYTLDEIEPLIPFHPQCRCVALPYIAELEKFYTRRR